MDQGLFKAELSDLSCSEAKILVKSLGEEFFAKEDEVKALMKLFNNDTRKSVKALGGEVENIYNKYQKEKNRVKELYDFDKSFGNYKYVAGVDEVGRGPLAGPIVAAAVVLHLDILGDKALIYGINDSKKLTAAKRKELSLIIKERALSCSIACIDSKEIDEKGIAYCNNAAFLQACNELTLEPQLILTDGYPIKNSTLGIRNEYVIKGDCRSASIACASIVAKVFRDELMCEYAKVYKEYGFENNAGYGTKEHIESIFKFGTTPIHRKSFLQNIL